MRYSGFILPNKDVQIISSTDYGTLYLEGNAEYDLYVKEFGDNLNPSSTFLQTAIISGIFGGETRVRTAPSSTGYMPRSFSRPFRANINFTNGASDFNFVGQSNMGVKEFKKFDVSDTSGWFPNPYLKNPKIIGFGSRMFLLADKRKFDNEKFTNYVHMWEWNSTDEKWDVLHIFTDFPTDSFENAFTLQEGSPDACIFDDELYVSFRTVSRSEGNNSILVFRIADQVELISQTIMTNSELEFDNFRLRCAASLNEIMVVIYGLKQKGRGPTGGQYYLNDMRTYVSYNSGYEFSTRDSYPSTVSGNRRQTIVTDTRSQSSMYKYFVKDINLGSNESTITGWNINFDLYYDKDMASFVIMKGGSVDYENNLQYLIAIKTVSRDLFSWEKCAEYRLNMAANGDVIERNGVFLEDVFFEDTDGQNAYEVLDVDIIDGLPVTTAMLNVESVNSSEGFSGAKGTAVFDFRFIDKTLIPNGNHEKILAYGGQFHDRYIFSTTPISKEFNGLSCPGAHNAISDVVDPRGCIYRNQIVMAEKKDVVDGYSLIGYPYLVFCKPWSNVTEEYGYEFSWTGFDSNYDLYGLTDNVVGTGSINYDAANYGIIFDTAAIPDQAYVSIEKATGNTNSPTILERASVRSPTLYWKSRFKFSIDSIPADRLWIYECALANPGGSGYGLKVRIINDGSVEVFTDLGVDLNIVNPPILSVDTTYEFLIGINDNRSGQAQAFLFWRESGQMFWQESLLDAAVLEAGLTTRCHSGVVSQTATGVELTLYELQLSTYTFGYLPTWHDSKVMIPPTPEGTGRYTATPSNYSNPFYADGFELYGNEIVLYDGTKIEFDGHSPSYMTKDDWNLIRSSGSNSMSFIQNGFPHYGFDFTDEISSSTFSIIFENTGYEPVDALALYNIHGVANFNLKSGDYNGVTWTNDTTNNFSIPRFDVSVTAFHGNTLIVSDSIEDNSLVGHTVMVFDTVGYQWVDSYQVVFNAGSVIKLNKAVSSITDRTFSVFSHSLSVEIPVAQQDDAFFEITFNCPTAVSIGYIGEVMFGTLYDTSGTITKIEEKVMSNHNFATTDNQFLFPKNTFKEPLYREFKCTSEAVTLYSRELDFISRFIDTAFVNESPIGLVFTPDRGGQLNYMCHLSGSSKSVSTGYSREVDFELVSIEYDYPLIEENFVNPPLLQIRADLTSLNAGVAITFVAVGYSDSGATLAYSWDFGDGNTGNLQVDSNTYASQGLYTVSCSVSDGQNVVTKFLTIEVTESLINNYVDSITALTSGTSETLTLTAKDSLANTVTKDSFTEVRVINKHPDLTFTPEETRLVVGVATLGIESVSAGLKTFSIEDSNGLIQHYSYTFT